MRVSRPIVVIRVLRFTFVPSVSEEMAKSIIRAFEALPQTIEQIAFFEGGETVPSEFGTAKYMYILGFSSKEEFEQYKAHPAHVAFTNMLEKGTVLDHAASSSDDTRVEVG